MKNLDKRKRVMARSMRLGRCICNPKLPCPCDAFKTRDVCLCAGETLPPAAGPVRLMETVEYAGCASKIDQASLKRILAALPSTNDPNVIVGMAAGDDAGVYRVSDNLALVQTVDVFCPSVDDPYTFGRIAAANSLSDVYAMGGRPLTALSILGFPIRTVPDGAMEEILRGGIDKMREAGVPVVGGHSINDGQIKAGFAVTGVIDPNRIITNNRAMPGDALVLTKPLGTGIISFAGQIGRAPAGALEAAASSMAALNRAASELMLELGAHAATDVTGFGLMGHLGEMAAASGVDVEIVWDDLPLLPGVLDCLGDGVVPGGIERNRESSAHRAMAGPSVTEEMLDICFDPETSGGLLVALPEAAAQKFVKRLHEDSAVDAAVIGKVTGRGAGIVSVVTTGRRKIVFTDTNSAEVRGLAEGALPAAAQAPADEACCAPPQPQEACCSDAGHGAAASAPAGSAPGHGEAQARFQEFTKGVNTPGALDAPTKEVLALALSIATRCGPCTKAHLKKARSMGFSEAEIEEAAWMAIFFGGAPVMMFYNEATNS